MRVSILGVPFDNLGFEETLNKLLGFLKEDKNHLLLTPNPEIVMEAQTDEELMKTLHDADLVIPDGIGIVIASRMLNCRIRERVAGCDLIPALFSEIKDTGKTVYILGAKPGVAEMAKKNMEQKYKNLKITGIHDGFFDEEEEEKIIGEIQDLKPDILLVGLGCPRQEKWIYRNRHRLPVKVSAGVGGSIDIMAGTVKRAPKVIQIMGLEWLHRLYLEPRRISRMKRLPLFLIKCLRNRKQRVA